MTVKDGTTTDEIYPSRFLKADDIDGKAIFTIVDVNSEAVGEDTREKLIVSFREISKDLVLNKTNAKNIEEMYGKPWYEIFIGGLGKYKKTASHGPFVHVDVRGFRARWGQ